MICLTEVVNENHILRTIMPIEKIRLYKTEKSNEVASSL
jgi:hypothetical protein